MTYLAEMVNFEVWDLDPLFHLAIDSPIPRLGIACLVGTFEAGDLGLLHLGVVVDSHQRHHNNIVCLVANLHLGVSVERKPSAPSL